VKVLILALVAATLFGCERRSSAYPSFQAALDDGAIDRGWVPEFLPGDSVEIRERHDIDTNEVWGSFRRAEGNLEELTDALCEIVDSVQLPNDPRVAWWPSESELLSGAYNLTKCEQVYFALGPENGYFWMLAS
jgi:hypothetical protein